MKRFNLFLLPLASVFFFAACGEKQQSSSPKPGETQEQRSIEAITNEYLAAYMERIPEMGTLYSLPGARHDGLYDNSLSALEAWQALEDGWLEELNVLEVSPGIGSRDWVSLGVLRNTLEGSIASRVCHNELWQASSATAWYTRKLSVFEVQPVDNAELQQQAYDRLRRLVVFIDTEIRNLRQGLAQGYSAPRITVVPAVAEVRALLGEESPLLSPGARSGDAAFEHKVRMLVDEEVGPAVERFARFLQDEYVPQAREEIGLDSNASGAGCYPAMVRYHATVSIPAQQIHQTGLEQITHIRAEMQTIIDQHYGAESIASFLRNLNTNPVFTFQSEDEVLQYSLDGLDAARARMTDVFGMLPKADVLIKPYPPHRASGTGEYHPSSEDGTRPGIYYIAVANPTQRSRATQKSVLFHETYPGHHLQSAIALELGDRVHPIARYLWNSGYAEGWGLYSERLADELGLYGSPLDRMGMLSDQAARSARLVVDTGLHTMGWSRQQAVDYMLANTAWAAGDIESEVNRYIAYPGQATSYMLGMLEIKRLRELAETRLGDDFSLSEFHDRVLENGSISLPMLDESIRSWIDENASVD